MVAASLAKRAISELFTQQVRAPTMSGSAAEAKRRSIYFFRDICRLIPAIMLEYNLDEVTTKAALRTQLANKWRVQVGSEPQDVDMLLFKGNEELTTVMSHHYNRHHLISKYVQPESNKRDAKISSHTRSKFVNDFLAN